MKKSMTEWLAGVTGEDAPKATEAMMGLLESLAELKKRELQDRVDVMFEALDKLALEQDKFVEIEVICTMIDGILRGSGEVPQGDSCS